MYIKAWCTCQVVVLPILTYCFLSFSLPSPSSLLKLPFVPLKSLEIKLWRVFHRLYMLCITIIKRIFSPSQENTSFQLVDLHNGFPYVFKVSFAAARALLWRRLVRGTVKLYDIWIKAKNNNDTPWIVLLCLVIIQTVPFKKLVYNANYCVTYKKGIPKICGKEGRDKTCTIMFFLEKIL